MPHSSRAPILYQHVQDIVRAYGGLPVCDHLRLAGDDRAGIMTVGAHLDALSQAEITDVAVVRQSKTMTLLVGRVWHRLA